VDKEYPHNQDEPIELHLLPVIKSKIYVAEEYTGRM
jgi:hypothetical protein